MKLPGPKIFPVLGGIALSLAGAPSLRAQAKHVETKHAQTAGIPHHHHHHSAATPTSGATSHAAHGAHHHHAATGEAATATHAKRHHDHGKAAQASVTAAHHRGLPHHASHAAAAAAAAAGAGTAAVAPDAASPPPTAEAAVPPATGPVDKGTNTGLPLPRFAAMRADKVFVRRGPGQRYPIDWVYHRRGLPVKIEREFDIWRLVEDSDGTKGWVHQATLVGQRTFVIPGEAPTEASTAAPASAAAGAPPASAGAGAAGTGGASGAAAHPDDQPGRADARVISHVAGEQEARAMRGVALMHASPDDGSAVVAVLEPGTVGNIKECPSGSGWCRVVVKGYSGWLEKRLFWGLLPGEVIQPS